MAPDSSLLRHLLGGFWDIRQPVLIKAALVPILVSLFFFAFHAQARAERSEFPGALAYLSPSQDTLKQEIPVVPVSLSPQLDTLKGTPPVLWRNRIQIPINEPLIQKYIRFYEGQGRKTYSDAMERAKTCIPQMTEILESFGVPGEMVSVVFVESRFEKHASYRGAGGYWQMLAPTARVFGLRVDRWVDERRDPLKSTKAAAKYLRKLFEQYDSWTLALAAYNAGCVPNACAVSINRVKDGELYGRKLPARSMIYVSKVMAAMAIMREPEQHGFERPNYCKPKDFDPIMVKSPLKLEEIAKWVDVPVSQLKELNPSLRMEAMPPQSGFALRLPPGSREKYDLAYDGYTGR